MNNTSIMIAMVFGFLLLISSTSCVTKQQKLDNMHAEQMRNMLNVQQAMDEANAIIQSGNLQECSELDSGYYYRAYCINEISKSTDNFQACDMIEVKGEDWREESKVEAIQIGCYQRAAQESLDEAYCAKIENQRSQIDCENKLAQARHMI